MSDIVSVLESYLNDCISITTELQKNREDATRYYLAQAIGGERPGRSNVVMTDVQDTVDWIMPSLVKQFCGQKAAVTFLPTSEQDVEAAKIETDYCNWVLHTKNCGFEIVNNWLQDGLVYRNGYVKVCYNVKTDQRVEEYKGVLPDQMALLMQDASFNIIEATQVDINGLPSFNVKGEVRTETGQIIVSNIPPENVYVSKDYRRVGLDGCNFVGHYEEKTIGDLIADGYDPNVVANLPVAYDDMRTTDTVDIIRQKDVYGSDNYIGRSYIDPSTRPAKIWEIHIRYDANGDGIPELHRVCYEQLTKTVLSDEVVDFVNICAWTPYIVAHRHIGLSVYDKLRELTRIKTALMRQMLDNLYLANNPRPVVNDSLVNMSDLLSPRIGSPIRVKDMAAVRFDAVPFVAANVFGALEYVDKVKEDRVGVNKQNQGLDPAALKDQSIYGMASLMGAANQKIEYIARVFAETGMRDLMQKIRGLAAKYASKEEIFQVAGNKYVATDPRAWVKKRDMQSVVGIGNVGLDEKQVAFRYIQQLQEKIIAAQGGAVAGVGAALVTAENVYNTITDSLEAMGVYEENRYFSKPDMALLAELANQPPPPNPAVIIAEKELQQKEMKSLVDSQVEMAKHQDGLDIEKERLKIDRDKNEIAKQKNAIELAKIDPAAAVFVGGDDAPKRDFVAAMQGIYQALEKTTQAKTFEYDEEGRIIAIK